MPTGCAGMAEARGGCPFAAGAGFVVFLSVFCFTASIFGCAFLSSLFPGNLG